MGMHQEAVAKNPAALPIRQRAAATVLVGAVPISIPSTMVVRPLRQTV
jgi:hypothetical protein